MKDDNSENIDGIIPLCSFFGCPMILTLEFDLSKALLDKIYNDFEDEEHLNWSSLSTGSLAATGVTDGQGVYQLGYRNAAGLIELVYIGKTDAKAGLLTRLTRHARKVSQRLNINQSNVFFKAIRVYVFTPLDLEQQLIARYKGAGQPPTWNTSGFGSNDPGRERDTTGVKDNHFDALFPINTGLTVTLPFPVRTLVTVRDVLSSLKSQLSYLIRFEMAAKGSKTPHPDLLAATVSFTTLTDSVENILLALKPSLTNPALGQPWQITHFPGYIIVYKESKTYRHGVLL